MTITHGILAIFLPVALITAALALLIKHGPGRSVRALAAAIWALSFALPRGILAFWVTFVIYFRRTMEMA